MYSFTSPPFPSLLPLWKGFRTKVNGPMQCCLKFHTGPTYFLFAFPFSSFISPLIFFFFPNLPSFPTGWEPRWEEERLTTRLVIHGLKVPWAWYTLPFHLPLLSIGVMGIRPITSPIYIRLTLANHENSNWTSALVNAPQNINPPDSLRFDKDTPLTSALKITLTAHL